MLFIGLPISACTAYALHTWADTNRRVAISYGATMITLGVISTLVEALFFQGPLAHKPGQSPFPNLHPEIMTHADARLLDKLPQARVLAPQEFSDVLALRVNTQVLGGTGSTDLSDQMSTVLQPGIDQFFAPSTDNNYRINFIQEWCIDYIYCPDTRPVDDSVRQQLKTIPNTTVVAEEKHGLLIAMKSAPGINE